jgi:hypothetical protein
VILHRSDGKALEVGPPAVDEPFLTIKTTAVTTAETVDNQPAEAGDVIVEASLDKVKGAFQKSVSLRLTTNHPEEPEIEIPVTLRVRPLIEARPAQVRLTVDPNAPAALGTMFRLTHNGGDNFEIKSVEVSQPDYLVVTQVTTGALRSHNIKVDFKEGLEKLPSTLNGVIKIKTSDPMAGEIDVPVNVSERRAVTRRPLHPSAQPPVPVTGTPGVG